MRSFAETITLRAVLNRNSTGGIENFIGSGNAFYRQEDGTIYIKNTRLSADIEPPNGSKMISHEEALKALGIRNLCAKIPELVCEELDSLCGFLNISKRDFIEAAIIDAIKSANALLSAEGVIPAKEKI